MSDLSGRILTCCILLMSSGTLLADESGAESAYELASVGTRQFEWETPAGPGWIKVLVEEANLGSSGAEIIEVFFPPSYESRSHYHELEILYVIEGELEHIVDGKSNMLTPGMVGIVRYPGEVIHKTSADGGARVLVIWPLGNEVKGLQGMQERPIQ